jgi:DNA-binding transcriptional ArsR family regulator
MVNYNRAAQRLDRVFSALADPTRRAIVDRLARGSATIGELASPFKMTAPAVTKHIKALERAGLLERTIDGRVHRCRLSAGPMVEAAAWIERHRRFWTGQLDSLSEYFTGSAPKRTVRRARRGRALGGDQ